MGNFAKMSVESQQSEEKQNENLLFSKEDNSATSLNPPNMDIDELRREHAEELKDLVVVVNDLKNKNEDVAQLKSFQEVQAAELTKIRKDFHELERDSKDTLEKSEYEIKKDIQTVNTKIEDLQGQIKCLNESMGN